jgi:Tol biopolymer transport system component
MVSVREAGYSALVVSRPDGSDSANIATGGSYNHPAFFDKGEKIVYSDSTSGVDGGLSQLYEIPSSGSQSPQPLLPQASAGCDVTPTADPAAGLIVFVRVDVSSGSCLGASSIWAYNTSTGTSQLLVANASAPDVSPDGSEIVFVRQVGSVNQLFTANIDGSEVTQLTSDAHGYLGTGGYNTPVWSPDGTRIAFSSNDLYNNGDQVDSDVEILTVSTGQTTVWNSDARTPAWQPSPSAAPSGTDLPIAYNSGSGLVLDPGAGQPTTNLATGATGAAVWDPKGNRYLYTAANGGLYAAAASVPNPVAVAGTSHGSDLQPAVDPSGSLVVFSSGGELYGASSDGDYLGAEFPIAGITRASGETDTHPTVASDGTIIYERDLGGAADIYADVAGHPSRLIANGMDPVLSPDGTKIAFIRLDGDGVDQVFTIAVNGVDNLTQLTFDATDDSDPAWSPDGTQIAYANAADGTVYEVSAADGTVVGSIANASSPSFQPSTPGHVVRLWGSNAIGTAIAASQYNWASVGTTDPTRGVANAVVLSRSDQFYDALTGSALATTKGGPLLITPPTQLEPQVLAEIQRILPSGGTVYLLGGTSALTPAVADAVTSAGYVVDRLAGSNEYGTAVAVDEAMTSHPADVMVATGVSYYDALSAGAAAANLGAVLVLTDNGTIPSASAAYLDTIDPTTTPYVAIGGPGSNALEFDGDVVLDWGAFTFASVVGNNAKDTALAVAQDFFAAPGDVAVATDAGWYDALAGGAMVGSRGGPLLLTDPTGLYGADATYLEGENFSLGRIEMLGGPAALPTALQNPLGATFGTTWDYTSFQPGSPELPFTTPARAHAPVAAVQRVRNTAPKQTVRK